MTFLKTLTFTDVLEDKPSPLERRRASLVRNLKDQLALLDTPNLLKTRTKKMNTDGHKQLVEIQTPVRPWWRETADGKIVFFVKSGLRKLEFEKGKTAIHIPDMKTMSSIIKGLISAVEKGELDPLIVVKDEAKVVIKKRAA